MPPVSPPERWALTPPFHPCQTLRALRRRPTGFPARCHRAALRRRSILCGTFRSAPSGTGFSLCSPLRPLALPGALPCQEFRSSQSEKRASGRCPDFPPAQPSCDDQASDHPARPPALLYLDHQPCGDQEAPRILCVKPRVLDLQPPVPLLLHSQFARANSGRAHKRVQPTKRPGWCFFQGEVVQSLRRQEHYKKCGRD